MWCIVKVFLAWEKASEKAHHGETSILDLLGLQFHGIPLGKAKRVKDATCARIRQQAYTAAAKQVSK
jgi:hypothetical protein